MKKISIILLLVNLLIFSNTVLAVENNSFKDVSDTEYYANGVDLLTKLDVLSGYDDGTFHPEKSVTRAEMAAIVCRMINIENEAQALKGKTKFSDVSSNHWASGYINLASDIGIINGYENGTFCPEAHIKHEEAIKMIVCALGHDNEIVQNPKDWSQGYLNFAMQKGFLKSVRSTKGTLTTRGDVAVLCYNGLSYLGDMKLKMNTSGGKAYRDYKNTLNSEYSYCIVAPERNYVRLRKKFSVEENKYYKVSAYFKTEDVINLEDDNYGANISYGSEWDLSKTLLGNNDWTKLNLVVYSDNMNEIEIYFNLGYWYNTCVGKVYITDISFEEMKVN